MYKGNTLVFNQPTLAQRLPLNTWRALYFLAATSLLPVKAPANKAHFKRRHRAVASIKIGAPHPHKYVDTATAADRLSLTITLTPTWDQDASGAIVS